MCVVMVLTVRMITSWKSAWFRFLLCCWASVYTNDDLFSASFTHTCIFLQLPASPCLSLNLFMYFLNGKSIINLLRLSKHAFTLQIMYLSKKKKSKYNCCITYCVYISLRNDSVLITKCNNLWLEGQVSNSFWISYLTGNGEEIHLPNIAIS